MADPGPSPYDGAVPPVFYTPPPQTGSVGAPPPPPPPTQPRCWRCGYNLSVLIALIWVAFVAAEVLF